MQLLCALLNKLLYLTAIQANCTATLYDMHASSRCTRPKHALHAPSNNSAGTIATPPPPPSLA